MSKKLLLVLFLILMGSLGGLYLYVCQDDEPPKDQSLLVTVPTVSDQQNGLYYLQQACKHLQYPQQENDKIEALLVRPPSDLYQLVSFVSKHRLIKKNQQVFEYLDKALACRQSVYPNVGELRITSEQDYLESISLYRVVNLISLKSLLAFKSLNQEKAFSEIIKILQLAQMISKSKVSTYMHNVSCEISRRGVKRIFWLLQNTTLEVKKLWPYISKLQQLEFSDQTLADAYRVEYIMINNTLDDFVAGKASITKYLENKKASNYQFWQYDVSQPFLFKPNRTKSLFSQAFDSTISSLATSYSQQQLVKKKLQEEALALKNNSKNIHQNVVGEVFFAFLSPQHSGNEWLHASLKADLRIMQLMLAVKCFYLRKKQWPSSLTALSPYLKKIPIDPYHNKSFGYALRPKRLFVIQLLGKSSHNKKFKAQQMASKDLSAMKQGNIPNRLRSIFNDMQFPLSASLEIKAGKRNQDNKQGNKWLIKDQKKKQRYLLMEKNNKIEVYTDKKAVTIYSTYKPTEVAEQVPFFQLD